MSSDSAIALSRIQRLHRWQWTHNSTGFDLVRMFVGGALLVRGLGFALYPSTLADLVADRSLEWVMIYVIAAHIGGGFFLLTGLFTRIGALVQIPILADATFFVHLREGLAGPNQSLELSALVLFLLVVIYLFGPGKWSLDYRLFGKMKE